jgi:hypothetical protein
VQPFKRLRKAPPASKKDSPENPATEAPPVDVEMQAPPAAIVSNASNASDASNNGTPPGSAPTSPKRSPSKAKATRASPKPSKESASRTEPAGVLSDVERTSAGADSSVDGVPGESAASGNGADSTKKAVRTSVRTATVVEENVDNEAGESGEEVRYRAPVFSVPLFYRTIQYHTVQYRTLQYSYTIRTTQYPCTILGSCFL